MISLKVSRTPAFCVGDWSARDKKNGECYECDTNCRCLEDRGHAAQGNVRRQRPAVALLRMEPGSEIPRHLHERTTEMLYVIDGDFINEGISYTKGTEINVKPNIIHGPQSTKTGCNALVTFSYPSVLDDFKLA